MINIIQNILLIWFLTLIIHDVFQYFSKKRNIINEEINEICTDEICINTKLWKNKIILYTNYYLTNYFKKRYFFSFRENSFYRKLCYVIQKFTQKNKYIIFSKVRVSDIIGSPSWSRSWLTINPWHFDFVICDSSDGFRPVMIIELDDSSHNDPKRQKIDKMKNEICEYIHLPLVRINGDFSDNIIKEQLKEILILENK